MVAALRMRRISLGLMRSQFATPGRQEGIPSGADECQLVGVCSGVRNVSKAWSLWCSCWKGCGPLATRPKHAGKKGGKRQKHSS